MTDTEIKHDPKAQRSYTITADDGEKIAVYESGPEDGPLVLLIHGMMLSHTYWDRIIDVLAQKYRVIRYDQRGHGSSGGRQGQNCTVSQLGRDLNAVLHFLNPDKDSEKKVFLAGHSMGGMAIGQWAKDFPQGPAEFTRGIFLCNTGFHHLICYQRVFGFRWPNKKFLHKISSIIAILPPGNNKFSRKILRRIFFSKSAPTQLVSEVLSTSIFAPAALKKILRSMFEMDVRAGVKNFTVPTTVVTSDPDNLTDKILGQEIANELEKSGHLREHVHIQDCGHMSIVDKPEIFEAALIAAASDKLIL